MPDSGPRRAVAAVLAIVLLLIVSASAIESPRSTIASGAAAPSSPTAATGSSTLGPSAPPPKVSFLNGTNAIVGASAKSFPLNFTVPVGASEEIYLWSIGGGLASFTPPSLPTGLTVATSFGFGGIAAGSLAPGPYTIDLSYAGWTNDVSYGIYVVSGGTGLSYQFANESLLNPVPPHGGLIQASVSLSSGAVTYLGVAGTGGYPIANSSLWPLAEEAPAWGIGGETQLIGTQPYGEVQASSYAEGLSLAAVGVYATGGPWNRPTLGLLGAVGELVGANNATVDLNFTVPASTVSVIFAWSNGGGLAYYVPPVLPPGLTIAETIGPAGLAVGTLAPGNYTGSLTYPGWTNDVSLAAYGVFDTAEVAYHFGLEALAVGTGTLREAELKMPAGASEYLGVVNTGGYAVALTSLSVRVAAPAWGMAGTTQLIGTQSSNALWATSQAAGLRVLGVGVYGNISNVTFRPTGLPSGAPWTLVLDNVSRTSDGGAITLPVARGAPVPYLFLGPDGYRVVGTLAFGTIRPTAANQTVSVAFQAGRTATVVVRASGQPTSTPWCADVGDDERCTLTTEIRFANLTPGDYPYSLEEFPGVNVTARLGSAPVELNGTVAAKGVKTFKLDYAFRFAVKFLEEGAPTTGWSVVVDGVTYSAAAGEPIELNLTDGTYHYRGGPIPGYRVSSSPKVVRVDGAPTYALILYVPRT